MVDVKAFMANEAAAESVKKLEIAIGEDKEASAFLAAAKSVEDVYRFVKRYITVKFEDFSAIFDDVMNYLTQEKSELSDDTLECVVGGWSWGGVWNLVKEKAVSLSVGIVLGAAVGALCGAYVGGPIGAAVGGVLGAVLGGVMGAAWK